MADSKNSALCSAIALAVGSTSVAYIPDTTKREWGPLFESWYQQPDPLTHVAAEWALEKWEIPTTVSTAAESIQSTVPASCSINSIGITMLKIPTGSYVRLVDPEIGMPQPRQMEQRVTLTRPFWIGDREVTLGQFNQFMDDADMRLTRSRILANEWRNSILIPGMREGQFNQ